MKNPRNVCALEGQYIRIRKKNLRCTSTPSEPFAREIRCKVFFLASSRASETESLHREFVLNEVWKRDGDEADFYYSSFFSVEVSKMCIGRHGSCKNIFLSCSSPFETGKYYDEILFLRLASAHIAPKLTNKFFLLANLIFLSAQDGLGADSRKDINSHHCMLINLGRNTKDSGRMSSRRAGHTWSSFYFAI
jgi:hypothetical protein